MPIYTRRQLEKELLQKRKTRGKSFKKFNDAVDTALKEGLFDECMHDIFCVLCEIGIKMTCPQLTQYTKSYEISTVDGKYSMSSKNMARSLLTFIKKTLPEPGLYTDGQIKRIKAIMKMNNIYLSKLTRVKHKGILTRWEVDA